MTEIFSRRWRRALLLAALLAAAASVATGYAQASSDGTMRPRPVTISASPVATASVLPGSPTPSVAPTTAPPSPSATTSSASPSTAAPTASSPSPSVSSSPAAASGPASLLWLWVLLAVIALVALIAVVSQVTRGRAAQRRAWRARAARVYAQGSALHHAVQAASHPGRYGGPDAGVRWADIQRRADDLTQSLYALRESAPADYQRARVDEVLTVLGALRSATQAADPTSPGRVQARLRDFQDALLSLRGPD